MKRFVRIARFAFTFVCVAMLTILIIRGRDPTFLNFHKRSRAEIALSRVIKRVNFQRIPFYKAINALSRAANIKIECDGPNSLLTPYCHNVSLTGERITLDDALRELLVSASEDQLHCFPEGDRIRIGNGSSRRGPVYVDEYVMPGFVLDPGSGVSSGINRSPYLPQLLEYGDISGLRMLPRREGEVYISNAFGAVWPPRLFVVEQASWHQEAHEIFEALQPNASAAARRKPPFGTDVLDYVDGTLRARDNRTATFALRSILPVVKISRQPFEEALDVLSAQVGVKISLTDDLRYVIFPDVEIDAKQTTLASALANLLGQASSNGIGFKPDRDTVWICRGFNPKLFRVFELQRGFAGCSEEECFERISGVRGALYHSRRSDEYYENDGLLGTAFIVSGPWDELELYEKIVLKWFPARPESHGTATPK